MSKHSFGTKFILVSDVRLTLPKSVFGGGPWEVLGVAQRGFKEYAAFRAVTSDTVYIEEVDGKDPQLFKKIEDDELWKDLFYFFQAAGCFLVDGVHKRATNVEG